MSSDDETEFESSIRLWKHIVDVRLGRAPPPKEKAFTSDQLREVLTKVFETKKA